MSNTPQIRFAGFTDAWEQRKLNEYLTVSTKKNTEDKYDKTDVLSVSGEVGVVNQIEFQGRSFAGASVSNYGVVETGDVVYTKSPLRANPYGIIKANKGKSGIVSTLYAVYKTIQGTANADFIECYFDLDDRLNMYLKPLVNIGAKHDMKVTDENALKGGVLFPSYEEQCQIADFFSRLDTLITLHQRECFSFDFSGESAKTAQKTISWEQRKLNEYLTVSTKKNTEDKYDKTDVLSVSGEVGVVNQIEFQGRSFAGASVSNYGVVETGDVVYTKSPLRANPYGIIKANKGKSGIVSTLYAVYKTIQGTANADFIECYFDLDDRLNMYLKPLVNIGAKHDMKVTDENALKGGVLFPSYEEQCQIADFFSRLDTLITLHQRKCDALQKFKKSMLQKMFPQNGESVPEIRFAGFTDAWEQRKLSDMVERVTRKNENLESELPLTISAQYGLIDQNEFFDKRIASRDVSGYYLLKKGEFAYNKSTSSDAPWGAVKRLDRYEMGVLSTLYIVFALKEDGNIDSDFLVSYYDTDCWHKGVQAIAAEGARNHGLLNITPADYFETVLTVPSNVKEQHQIGTFFAKLDSLITLHQRKLETLQKMKKSLLQKMFV